MAPTGTHFEDSGTVIWTIRINMAVIKAIAMIINEINEAIAPHKIFLFIRCSLFF